MNPYPNGTYTLLVRSTDRNVATIKILVQH